MPAPTLNFDPSSLAKYGRLTMVARNVVEGFLSGVHKSPYKGFSVEFAEHRQYYPGDEIRHIDWRVLGKTDRYYIKEYEEETNLKAYLLVDASGSMAFQSQDRSRIRKNAGELSATSVLANAATTKFQYVQYVAASLAYLMLHQLDAVGLITHDTKIRQLLPPRASSRHLLHILQILDQTEPGGETSMAPLWHELAGKLSRRGMVVILSDCFDQLGPLLRALQHFRHQRHEVILFHILAPEEIEFPFRKWTQFRNLEKPGHRLLVDPQRLRKEYLENFNNFCNELRRQVRQMQIDYHLVRTDQPVEKALGIYLTKRQSRK
jgi:uncharacterized protein (DUF58 family)